MKEEHQGINYQVTMRIVLFASALLLCSALKAHAFEDSALEDDDFADFEQFEVDDDSMTPAFKDDIKDLPKINMFEDNEQIDADVDIEDELIIEEEDNEFEHFQDPEEFEGFQETTPRTSEQPKITISKVPITIHPRWDAYWLEVILCFILSCYTLVYAIGRTKNTALAMNLLKMHKPLLEENFTLVGEKGSDVCVNGEETGWRREAEHCYTMWCSGRVCCEGMLLTLKLIKRQDLVHVLINAVRPSSDQLQIRVELGKDDSDPFVLCVAQKKLATKLSKEMQDLTIFCPDRRPGDKHNLPNSLSVMSESAEATAAILDSRVVAALNQYHHLVQYIHISDKYCGVKQIEDTPSTKPPETEKVMLVTFSIGEEEEVRPLLLLVFYLMDKLKRLRLSKEALAKCEKRRRAVVEAWSRTAHSARQEQAAARRDQKRKEEKERILAEDDPEKQRRWELKEQKRQNKKKNPKMKQLKVKAL